MSKYTTPAERIAERHRMTVLEMRESGMTLQEIATTFGCSRQAVHQMLKRYAAAVDRRKREA